MRIISPPSGQLAISGDIFEVEGLILAFTAWKPGMLLSVLKAQDDPPPRNEDCSGPKCG